MRNTKHIDQLLDLLATKQSSGQLIPEEIIHGIAHDPLALEELAAFSTALIGEASTLLADVAHYTAEPMDLELLSAYVEAQLAGAEVTLLYPTMASRIENDASFRMEYEALLALLQAEAQGHFGPVPGALNITALQQQAATPVTRGAPVSALWQEAAAGVYHLWITIPILVSKSTASFGQLVSPLTPALVPAGVYRTRTDTLDSERSVEVLTLPSQVGLNWAPQVRLGPIEGGCVTLILVVNMLTPLQPIPQAKVLLRDADGNLLESIATDEKGLAVFERLELGTYQFRIEYNGKAEQFDIALTPQND